MGGELPRVALDAAQSGRYYARVPKPLGPPPSHPTLSPPVSVAGEAEVMIPGIDGEPALEARLRAGAEAIRAVLLCHPHPLYGGTMHSAVIVALAKVLALGGEKVATLRFNYRGVGASEGRYGDGLGEVLDVRAALRELQRRSPRAALSIGAYSFGTWVGLRGAALEGGVERVALIAPAVNVFEFAREDGALFRDRLAIYVGDHDEFCSVDDARALAETLGATLRVFPGNDHFFLASRRKLAEAVVPFVAPEVALPP